MFVMFFLKDNKNIKWWVDIKRVDKFVVYY